jgi:hypothetical protein
VSVCTSFETKLKLVDCLGEPIKIIYRNPFDVLFRQWSDPELRGKIYVHLTPLFVNGQRMFSNFGNCNVCDVIGIGLV